MAKSKPFTLEDLQRKGFVADKDGNFVKTYSADYGNAIDFISKEDIKLKKDKRPKAKISKPDPAGLQAIKNVLKSANIPFETEYRFDTDRRFKFDIFIPSVNCGIEYEGLMSAKSRHTTKTGYSKDCEKYNLCQIKGFKVLRYTAMNFKNFLDDLKQLI